MDIWEKSKFFKLKMADGRHIENRFLAISRRRIGRFMLISKRRWRITCIGHLTIMTIFANSKWRTAAILKIALSPYLSRNYAISITFGMPVQISIYGYLTKKLNSFQIQDGGRTPYWKSFFGYISAPYWPIDAKFGKEMKNHMPIQVTCQYCNFPKFKMADGRHFENSVRRLRHSRNELMLSSDFQ